ncbi:MAG: hypothetical protein L0Y35_02325 [Flammeovirgaceae bacterium]|nr:hypothetical protein [Flammeovirgaceae bacterium]
MINDPNALKSALRKRELELQRLIKQMKDDNLQTSVVFKSLENELEKVKENLELNPQDRK